MPAEHFIMYSVLFRKQSSVKCLLHTVVELAALKFALVFWINSSQSLYRLASLLLFGILCSEQESSHELEVTDVFEQSPAHL